jgi:hypothetical protein
VDGDRDIVELKIKKKAALYLGGFLFYAVVTNYRNGVLTTVAFMAWLRMSINISLPTVLCSVAT